ncbi:MAP kinase kinase PBS2 [Trichoderma lentiforme]|uniref:mitogen-activated protein kinase kinase n=1 Tax=Trichoderma lentiforme TaxID=1567552 RepID=A0A9P4XFR8_9HYPO|nr:MAP kinase kinase PBS2 [Trichoderma lentiforme]
MSGSGSVPATPDSVSDGTRELSLQASPYSEDSSVAGTPNGDELGDSPKRLPSLNTFSDPRNMNPNSTTLGILGKARHPPQATSSFVGGAGAMENSVMAKARALHQQRMQKGMAAAGSSPVSPMPSPGGPVAPGFPNLRMPPTMQRPGAVPHPRSAPVLPKPSLSERRANMGMGMKLSDIGGSGSPMPTGGLRRAGAPSFSAGMPGNGASSAPNGKPSLGSQLDDFKKYIDTEKGWITFDGAATITRTGVNFSNGQTFSISLDEVEIIDELGKGNYGTVYKVRHAKPSAPRFGPGLSGAKLAPHPHRSQSDSAVTDAASALDGRTGKVMAMKEIRLELDDAKFTTILKELVILHECVSPFIIDFYGAFFQEGAVYMCIEYMDGGSIDKIYAGGIPENVLRKITYSAIMGLKSLKDEHNIIHRDVKPTNILANTRGQIKICDFGVSGNLVASIAKTNIGCQSYMAPERISGGAMAQPGGTDGTYSVQSDVWSLGLTIIECAMGQYPYPPEASSTIFSQLNAIVEGEPPAMPEEGYTDMAKDFVKSCLHKIPKMRPTYALLLKHPWIQSLTKPETIDEEAEDGEAADKVAEAVGHMDLSSGTEDAEVAEWVKSVLKKNADGHNGDGPSKPALHAAPLDSISPLGSPVINQGL